MSGPSTTFLLLQHGYLPRFRHHAVRFVVLPCQVLEHTTTAKLFLLVFDDDVDIVARVERWLVVYPLLVREDLKQRKQPLTGPLF